MGRKEKRMGRRRGRRGNVGRRENVGEGRREQLTRNEMENDGKERE